VKVSSAVNKKEANNSLFSLSMHTLPIGGIAFYRPSDRAGCKLNPLLHKEQSTFRTSDSSTKYLKTLGLCRGAEIIAMTQCSFMGRECTELDAISDFVI